MNLAIAVLAVTSGTAPAAPAPAAPAPAAPAPAATAPAAPAPTDTCSSLLLTVEADGTVSAGSKDRLRQAARAGLPLRIGWHVGGPTADRKGIDHWADAAFVSEFGGDVFAQVAAIQKQVPQAADGRIALAAGRWTGLLGSNGSLEGFFEGGEATPSVKVRQTWCVDARACASPSWRLVYRHGADGQAQAGSKDALFDAVRRGRPVRLAWGTRAERAGRAVSVEHAADPVFATIMGGGELFVQLPEHVAQASYFEPDQALFDRPGVVWRGLMGTTGSFDAAFVDRGTGQEVKRLPQRAAIAWFALSPDPLCDGEPAAPLAVSGGVRLR
jgi:hypothetical protein